MENEGEDEARPLYPTHFSFSTSPQASRMHPRFCPDGPASGRTSVVRATANVDDAAQHYYDDQYFAPRDGDFVLQRAT